MHLRSLDLRQVDLSQDWTLGYCKSLLDVKSPTSTEEIPDFFFEDAWNLERLNLSECPGLFRIGQGAFEGCARLASWDTCLP